ncbi:MAG: hypothetical protein ABII88_08490 [Candidatus Omnitrophota bacterium]
MIKHRKKISLKIAISLVLQALTGASGAWAMTCDAQEKNNKNHLSPQININSAVLQNNFTLTAAELLSADKIIRASGIRLQLDNRQGWYFANLSNAARSQVIQRLDLHLAEISLLVEILRNNLPGKEIEAIYFMGSSVWGPDKVSGINRYNFEDLDTVVIVKGAKGTSFISIKKGLEKLTHLKSLDVHKMDVSIVSTDELQALSSADTADKKDLDKASQLAAAVWGHGVLVYGKDYFSEAPSVSVLIDRTLPNLLHAIRTEIGKYKKTIRELAEAGQNKKRKNKKTARQQEQQIKQLENKSRRAHLRVIKRLVETFLVCRTVNSLYAEDLSTPLPNEDVVFKKIGRQEKMFEVFAPDLFSRFLAQGANSYLFEMLTVDEVEKIHQKIKDGVIKASAAMNRKNLWIKRMDLQTPHNLEIPQPQIEQSI